LSKIFLSLKTVWRSSVYTKFVLWCRVAERTIVENVQRSYSQLRYNKNQCFTVGGQRQDQFSAAGNTFICSSWLHSWQYSRLQSHGMFTSQCLWLCYWPAVFMLRIKNHWTSANRTNFAWKFIL